jgi:hypothetical protein
MQAEAGDVAVRTGRDVWRWLRKNEAAARRYAASELVDLHNDSWNEGKPVSIPGFAKRLYLRYVGVRVDGSAVLEYDDGGLFRGHSIAVKVGPCGELRSAQLSG